ncbi:uncharacterized protein LOC141535985 [Cotesia typhae]|uniref:uncharacterized protein LOC141535985 n=1 Tax=Cotesia typhae TaxID=2053667 RepID=UPI003D685D2B
MDKISPGYIPPSKDQLSGRLLDEEYQLLKSVMKNKLENANSLTILSDGWTDINRCSIINIVFMAPEPIFYKAIDASSESHTGTFIAGILSTAIEEVGPHKVHARKSQSYVEDKYLDRKDFISHPVHFAAHLLNPQLFNCPLVEADKIEAVNFIEKFAENLELNSQQVITDLGDYCTQQAVWSNKSLWTESKISNSITWWKLYFSNRDLAKLAVIILNIPATSAACERNWSVFGNIKTKKRNRLSVEKTEKLVFVKSNLCLLDDDCLLQASNNNIPIAEISNASETVVIDSTIDQDLDDVEEPEYLNLEEIMDWEVDENCNIEMISG